VVLAEETGCLALSLVSSAARPKPCFHAKGIRLYSTLIMEGSPEHWPLLTERVEATAGPGPGIPIPN
jgi:hypothetical protein